MSAPAFAASLALLAVAAFGAAAAAFVLSVPGAERSWAQRAIPVAAALAWPVIWILVLAEAPASFTRDPLQTLTFTPKIVDALAKVFDPEIPVNIVELGLVYGCEVQTLPAGGNKAVVRFTLTAQGCGMGQFIKEDIRKKLLALPEIREADVDLVWDPPWNQSRISAGAKLQLGIE
jgi:metal-sulfur cluster biosynthetic enzyme